MGHPPDSVWAATPRQLAGWLTFARARQRRETAHMMEVQAMAVRGELRDLKKAIRELQKE